MVAPGQNVWSIMPESCGVGFTVIVNCLGVPVHAPMDGVTVILEIMGKFVVFVAVNDGMFPLPVDGSPMPGLLLVQVKVLPVTSPSGVTPVDAVPLHKIWLSIESTVATGFTVIL